MMGLNAKTMPACCNPTVIYKSKPMDRIITGNSKALFTPVYPDAFGAKAVQTAHSPSLALTSTQDASRQSDTKLFYIIFYVTL